MLGCLFTVPPIASISEIAVLTFRTPISTCERLASGPLGVVTRWRIISCRHGSAWPRYEKRPGNADGITGRPVTCDQKASATPRWLTSIT